MTWNTCTYAFASLPQFVGAPPITNATHASDDTLERYAMGALQCDPELSVVEEHLLACPSCVKRAEVWEDYVWNVRASLRQSWIQVIDE